MLVVVQATFLGDVGEGVSISDSQTKVMYPHWSSSQPDFVHIRNTPG